MKTRKQWIAMLLVLAMLMTALPIAAFAEGEPAPQGGQGNEWTGPSKTVYLNVWFGIGDEDFESKVYQSKEWNSTDKHFSQGELNALDHFFKKLPEVSTFEYRNDEGKWVKFTPTEWTNHPTAPGCRWFQAPAGKYVCMKVSTERLTELLPENFSLAEFDNYEHRVYIDAGNQQLDLSVYKYKLVFNSNKGTFPGGGNSHECYIQPDGTIPYPDKPTRDGYLFHDWFVPIYYTRDLKLGGTMTSNLHIKTEPTEGNGKHVAVLKHGDTNGTSGWTANHFWWVFEREKQKTYNPRTLYARWERPELVFYNKSRSDNPTDTDIKQTNRVCNGKSIAGINWDAQENQDLLTPHENKITDVPKLDANAAGEEFDHWIYVDKEGNEQKFDKTTVVDEDKLVDGKMKLYPVFGSSATPDPGTSDPTPSVPSVKELILFDANGGAWDNGETRREYRRTIGSTITIEAAPTREGYKFLYWKGSEHHPGESYTVPDGGHTFVAQWEKVEKKPEDKPSVPSVDSKIKTPRGSILTADEIAKILAGSKKAVPAIPRAGVGR